jgi:hypothetical protein
MIVDNVASNGAIPNTSNGSAGAIYNDSYGLLARNCLIWRNAAHSGYRGAGGIWGSKRNDYTGTVAIESCTIVSNSFQPVGGTGTGAGGYFFSGTNFMTGCIVYHNEAPSATWRDVGFNSSDRFTTNFYAYTCAQFTTHALLPTQGNIMTDPKFANFTAGDFQLAKHSPCINTATNLPWMVGAVDLAGNPRLDVYHGGRADMGAFEYTVGPPSGTTLIVR